MQARWPKDRVDVTGRYTEYVRISDAGGEVTFRFCPDCGATVFWTAEDRPDSIAVMGTVMVNVTTATDRTGSSVKGSEYPRRPAARK
jgi:hypothetical protein